MNCYLCKSCNINLLHTINKWNIYRCNKCSYVFVYPLLNKKQLKNIYKNFKKNIFEKAKTTLCDAKHSLNFINKYRNKRTTLLDIGCGSGIFLEEASKKNWQVSGIEISSKLGAYLRNKFNFKIFKGDVMLVDVNRKYDLITLNQIIEHFSKSRLLVKRCYKLLNNKGLIYISTPNISSNFYKIRRERFDYLIPPEHLSYYNKKTLFYLLRNEGFKVLKFNTWSYPVDLAGIIKFFINKKAARKMNVKVESRFKPFDLKYIKYYLFDRVFCHMFYKMLNINNGGTMIEVIAIKQ